MENPAATWDCHTHCFHPDQHPFKSTRAYTPEAATIEELQRSILADNVMIVQATIEDGHRGLLDTLRAAKLQFPQMVFRGTVLADSEPGRGLLDLSQDDFAQMHELGIRSIRVHGSYGGSGADTSWAYRQLRQAAKMFPVEHLGWSITAQLPLGTWSALSGVLAQDDELRDVVIVADHNGSASPQDLDSPDMKAFLTLLEAGSLYVKLGALHRRSGDVRQMEGVVKILAAKAPHRILWGSDWPHVDASCKGLVPMPHLRGVSDNEELQLIQSWLTEAQREMMLVSNPDRLFGQGPKES